MKRIISSFFSIALVASFSFTSCNNSSEQKETVSDSTGNKMSTHQLKEDNTTYSAGGTTMNGYVVYSDSTEGKRPAVLVVHEWWGLNDYTKSRARQLAQLGYIAMAVDMYGNGQTAANPDEAQKLAGPFYQNPQLAKTRLDAALAKLKTYPQTDTANIAAIGYCYGGYVVLNAVKLGEPLKGVVSFHGDLSGVAPRKDLLKASILVCHGDSDRFVSPQAVALFQKQMDSVGADYTVKHYANATHAFTNPNATESGKKFNLPIAYNEAADKASWNDMKTFFDKIFH
jgi:dienelactone hydrolase